MGQCLITKLKGVVNDDSIRRIGELRIKVSRRDSPSSKSQSLNVQFSKEVTLEIIGDGYFTDSALSENQGKTKTIPAQSASESTNLYYSNGDYEISISDKYALGKLTFYSNTENTVTVQDMSNKSFDIGELAYSNDITSVNMASTGVSGDISALKGKRALNAVNLTQSGVTGDISAFSESNMSSLTLSYTEVTGDFSALANLTGLALISLSESKVRGNLYSFSTLVNLSSLYVSGCVGELSSLYGLNKLGVCSLRYSSVTGDLALLPDSCYYASFIGYTGSGLSWTERKTSAYIMAIEGGVKINNVDKMLQDQANCTKAPQATSSTYLLISVTGTRTSASDTAISTLQGKGFTVIVPEATDASSVMTMAARGGAENFGIAYQGKELIVEPVDLSKQKIYPAPDVTVETFATKEEAERFIKEKGLEYEANGASE